MREIKVKLPDGRHVQARDTETDGNRTIIFFHGAPSSRLFLPPGAEKCCRIVSFDRPGYGMSSPAVRSSRVAAVGSDVMHVLDALNVDKAVAVGVSAGGAYALASAAALQPRIAGVAAVSCIGPMHRPGAARGMNRTNRLAFLIARWMPFLMRPALSGMARKAQQKPEELLDSSGGDFAIPDRNTMQRDAVRKMYLKDLPEAYAQGPEGHASDLLRISRHWGFSLEEVHVPVTVWHGEQDNNVPPRTADELAAHLPNAVVRREAHLGHLLLFDRWQRIVDDIWNRAT